MQEGKGGVAFTVQGSMRRRDDGTIMISLTPSLPYADLTDQQILDSVVELLLWQGCTDILGEPDPAGLDS